MGIRNTLVHTFRTLLPEWFFRLLENLWEYQLQLKHYGKDRKQILIWTQDESVNPGGLSDRIQGMVTGYSIARKLGLEYKIDFTSPFPLKEFLAPNEVDWVDYTPYKGYGSEVLIFRAVHTHNPQIRERQLIKAITKAKGKEIHLYTNLNIVDDSEFHRLFHILFKPSEKLQEAIKLYIAEPFCSVTFRFQQLLGDFKEGNYKVLDKDGQKKLIAKCLTTLDNIHKKTETRLLVTSDSSTFLEIASAMPFVRIVKGKVIHIAYTYEPSIESHLKSFIDLFLISKAETVYSVCFSPMYNSGFPRLGAKIGNRPFLYISEETLS